MKSFFFFNFNWVHCQYLKSGNFTQKHKIGVPSWKIKNLGFYYPRAEVCWSWLFPKCLTQWPHKVLCHYLAPVGVCRPDSCFKHQFLLLSFHEVSPMYFTHNTLLVFILFWHFIILYTVCVLWARWLSEVKPNTCQKCLRRRFSQNQTVHCS